jgi:FtsH-binding integral membrane protein
MADKLVAPAMAFPAAATGLIFGLQPELLLGGFMGAFVVAVFSGRTQKPTFRMYLSAAAMLAGCTILAAFIGEGIAAWLFRRDCWYASHAAAMHTTGALIGLSAQSIVELVQAVPLAIKDRLLQLIDRVVGSPATPPKDGDQ